VPDFRDHTGERLKLETLDAKIEELQKKILDPRQEVVERKYYKIG
jgi:hypothetical protein